MAAKKIQAPTLVTSADLRREGVSPSRARAIVANHEHRAFATAVFATREFARDRGAPPSGVGKVTRFLRTFLRCSTRARTNLLAYLYADGRTGRAIMGRLKTIEVVA